MITPGMSVLTKPGNVVVNILTLMKLVDVSHPIATAADVLASRLLASRHLRDWS
jgi:hypothetical protein